MAWFIESEIMGNLVRELVRALVWCGAVLAVGAAISACVPR